MPAQRPLSASAQPTRADRAAAGTAALMSALMNPPGKQGGQRHWPTFLANTELPYGSGMLGER